MKRVYFIKPIDAQGPIKIGCSATPETRLYGFSTWSPLPLQVICSVEGSHKDERTLHTIFARDRLHGEWFEPSEGLSAVIEHCQATGLLPDFSTVFVRAKYARKPWGVAIRLEDHRLARPILSNLLQLAAGQSSSRKRAA